MCDQRRRYPRFNVGYVFSLGVPRTHDGRYFNCHDKTYLLDGKSGDSLEAFDGKVDEAIARVREEVDERDDIVLGDFKDTYYNLTWKSIMNYRWMSAFCRAENVKLFMAIDDDHRVNLSMEEEFLQRVPESK